MVSEWCRELLLCAEGMFVLKEESKEIIWANAYYTDRLKTPCLGEPCWRAFLKRETPCPFCPKLSEQDGLYAWEHYDPIHKHWMKVKHLVFRRDGVLYRAGNINMIDDLMRLNYETVQEISMLQTDLTRYKGEMSTLAKEAICDSLTGLVNRNGFQVALEREYADVSGLGVLYFDLNNLKETNDKYGHAAGDALLRRIADVLRLICAQLKHAKCYRVGGDEFVLLLTQSTREALKYCSEMFGDCMDKHNQNETLPCSVAVGQAYSEGPCNPEMLVSQADHAMYRCKQMMKDL